MIRHAAAHGGEIFHPLAQGLLQPGEAADLRDACDFAEPVQIVQVIRLLDVHGLVGPPGGKDFDAEAVVFRNLFVPFQRVRRVVRGADQGHVALFDQIADAHGGLGQLFVAQVPNFIRRLLIQYAVVAEISLQLQMAPVEQRIADGLAQAFCPFAELLVVGGIAGDIFLLHAEGTHQAPLVMVAAQPYLGDVVEMPVLRDFPGVDMAMVIQYRCVLRVIMEQLLGRLGFQQEIFVHKFVHVLSPPFFLAAFWFMLAYCVC